MYGHGSTILITGGSTGIGAGLARALHARGATVIVAGRDRARLERVARDCPGMQVEVVDVGDVEAVYALAGRVAAAHPGLDVLINNAGIQNLVDFTQPGPLPRALLDAELDVNLRGLIHMSNAFLPLLKRRPAARLVQVSSALAWVPLVIAPVYSASKAAVHAFSIALREQLRGSAVKVVEILPPAVVTELHRHQQRKPLKRMGLDEFVAGALAGLDADDEEVVVGLARAARAGARLAPRALLRIVNKSSD